MIVGKKNLHCKIPKKFSHPAHPNPSAKQGNNHATQLAQSTLPSGNHNPTPMAELVCQRTPKPVIL